MQDEGAMRIVYIRKRQLENQVHGKKMKSEKAEEKNS